MKKNILKSLFITVFILSINLNIANAIPAAAEKTARETGSVSATEIAEEEAVIIKKFSFKNKLQRSPENQIKSFYKNFFKYSEKDEVEKLKSLYSETFINSDGFNKNTIFKMMSESADVYKDITYSSNIEKISADENYAVVDVHEFAMGSTTKKNEEVDDYGIITSDLYYTDFLKKEGNKWKIISTRINNEKLALKYGEAKTMPVTITAPSLVPAGSEYDARVDIKSPDGVLVIGSIINEPIVYPQVKGKEVFRSVKSDILERVIKANNDNYNEYVSATIGLTRATIEPPNVLFKMAGMALVMSRVNVVSERNNKINN